MLFLLYTIARSLHPIHLLRKLNCKLTRKILVFYKILKLLMVQNFVNSGFDILTEVSMRIQVFRDVTQRQHVNCPLIDISIKHAAYICKVGRYSSVGIATRYELDGRGIESRRGAINSAPVQNCPGAQPTYYKTGNWSLTGCKAAGAWRRPSSST